MSNRRLKKRKKKLIWLAVLAVSLIGIILIGMYIAGEQRKKERAAELYAQMQAEKNEAPEETVIPEEPKIEIPVDFAALKQQNEDIYAWIEVPGTTVDYPILQSAEADDYYLNHTVEHKEGRPGAIYTEKANAKDFSDPNTVIYGHNMHSNHTMFYDLHLFEDETFFDEHETFTIYTPTDILEYEIFAAYVYDDRHILNSFDFKDKDVFAEYLKNVLGDEKREGFLRDGVKVTADDRIVTLSTCIKGRADKRWLIQAVLKDED